jgi:hypothetical protein
MATESIGTLIPTAIPGYTDSADIQAALRAYHYGSYSYDPANTSPGSLVTPSIAKTIYDIEQDIISLENRPSSGGEVNATEPVPGDFTPPSIPDGFIWVDSDGSTGNGPFSATSIFTNSAPTANLTTGVIWVDKDPTSITVNPFIPQTIIGAKGDLVVGTANDTASVLNVGTNGFVLSANSSTTSGLEWIANEVGDITGVTAGVGISGGGTSGAVTITNSMATEISAKADLIVGTGSQTFDNLTVGANNTVLTADSSTATGLKWAAPSSRIVQVVNTQTGTSATGTTVLPNDGTVPQNTEGTQFMTLSITPTNASNKLFIQVVTRQAVTGSNKDIIIALFQDSTVNALAANNYRQTGDGVTQLGVLNYYMTAGTTSSTEFKIRIGSADTGTVTFCPNAMGQIASSTITITEIAV